MARMSEPTVDYDNGGYRSPYINLKGIAVTTKDHLELSSIRETDQDSDTTGGSSVPTTSRDSGNESMDSKRSSPLDLNSLNFQTSMGLLRVPSNQGEGGRVSPAAFSRASSMRSNAKQGSSPRPSTKLDSFGSTKDAEAASMEDEESSGPPTPIWDIFKTTPKKKVRRNTEELFMGCIKFFKIMAYIVMFTVTLSSAITSKASLLIMTDHLGALQEGVDRDGVMYLLLFALCVPHAFSLLASLARGWFGNTPWPSLPCFFFVLSLETLHSAGQTFFVMYAMPRLTPLKIVVLMMAVGQIPALAKVVFFQRTLSNCRTALTATLDLAALVMQLFMIPCVFSETLFDLKLTSLSPQVGNLTQIANAKRDLNPEWAAKSLLVLSLIAMSIRWWEAYATSDITLCSRTIPVSRYVTILHKTRTKTHIVMNIWKIAVTVLVTFLVFGDLRNLSNVFKDWTTGGSESAWSRPGQVQFVGKTYATTFSPGNLTQNSTQNSTQPESPVMNNPEYTTDWVHLGPFFLHMFSTWILYHFATVACKLHMQRLCFAAPLLLSSPFVLTFLTVMCSEFNVEKSAWPVYLKWSCAEDLGEQPWQTILIGLGLWWLSSIWITAHVWTPDNERLAFTDRLFVVPVLDPVLTGQTYLYSRRKDDHFDRKPVLKGDNVSSNSMYDEVNRTSDTMIYLCATMWHENVNEMIQILKSVFRLDKDQSKRRRFRDLVSDFKDPDYYEFEVHILFDDAFDIEEDKKSYPNGFVKQLISVIQKAASEIHGNLVSIPAPVKMVAPYGGRLEWTLPGENKIVAHLKDKNKVRHRKRWSQVMYMYYLLGYRMFEDVDRSELEAPKSEQESVIKSLPPAIKRKAENTYLLALDGDVDFKPEAVLLLVDMMKKNKQVGAACGRIKPIGSGPVMWYQRFEYAIGHWLQKAAEHMFGCVLCSPGCFSMFRGLALMDNNVMRTYATKPTEALHFLQYDQGEDRWLCTLLLQRGYKIEYCAAADALTYVPETFNEFFNQRRRWGPSTTANIIDLLGSYRETVKVNPNISNLYIVYQFVLLASSLLGPATVLLMVQSSLHAVFYGIPTWATYTMIFLPTVIFTVACFKCKSDTQLIIAAVFSAMYALVMMAVIAGTAVSVIQDGWYTPNALFLYIIVGSFVIAALLHPQEMFDLPWGILYFLCVPATFIYLMIYSICNLNVVSWGTREVKKPTVTENQNHNRATAKAPEQEVDPITQAMNEIKMEKSSQAGVFGGRFNIFGRRDRSWYVVLLAVLQSLKEMRAQTSPQPNHGSFRPRLRSRLSSTSSVDRKRQFVDDENEEDESFDSEDENDPDIWTKDPELGDGVEDRLEDKEAEFFEGLISRYLYPLSGNKEQEEKISADLIELRNNVSFAFFMMNGLWLVIMIALQEVKSLVNITIEVNETVLKLEPLGLIFLVIFAIILLLQFVAMLMHRYGTFVHILATTELFNFNKEPTQLEQCELAMAKIDELQSFPEMQDNSPIPPRNIEVRVHKPAPSVLSGQNDLGGPPSYSNITHRRQSVQGVFEPPRIDIPQHEPRYVPRPQTRPTVPPRPYRGGTLRGNFGVHFNSEYNEQVEGIESRKMSLDELYHKLQPTGETPRTFGRRYHYR